MAIVTSVLTGGVNNHPTTSEEVNAVATDFASQGIVGTLANTNGVAPATGGFAVNAQGTPDATVAVGSGTAYVTGTPTSQTSQTFRIKNSASANVTISANASGSTKYDWVYIKLDPTNLNAPNTAGDNSATLVTSRSSSSTSDDGTPPTYGYNIAVVTVANGFTTITNANIRDTRVRAGLTASPVAASTASWEALGYTPSSVTANGNRSYDLLFSSIDLTSTISPGMRLRTTRTVAAPTQCTSLNGTTQYYSKSSPNKMTFTDDFVVSGHIPAMDTYANMCIASRYNGTSGWSLEINSSGQVILIGYNAGAANFSYVQSYQSIPLNKKVHIAALLDMSAFTAAAATAETAKSWIMIDGLEVPALVARGGTNPTALVQAGDLQIGAKNATNFFDGKLAQIAIYSSRVTQAVIRASMNQTLSGSETSLASAYSFNNSIADLNTTTPNDLTANGSAVATNADSPFGTQASGLISSTLDYAIIQKATFSTNTTVTVQVPEGCTIPTSGGVTAVSYSTQKAPYGFPGQRGKWLVDYLLLVQQNMGGATAGTWYNLGASLTIPVGEWVASYSMPVGGDRSSDNYGYQYTLSTGSSTETNAEFTALHYSGVTGGSLVNNIQTANRSRPLTVSTQAPYYFNISTQATGTSLIIYGDFGTGRVSGSITAENAYL
jgi:hypothetical protein